MVFKQPHSAAEQVACESQLTFSGMKFDEICLTKIHQIEAEWLDCGHRLWTSVAQRCPVPVESVESESEESKGSHHWTIRTMPPTLILCAAKPMQSC